MNIVQPVQVVYRYVASCNHGYALDDMELPETGIMIVHLLLKVML